jgi:hypothetical protein
MVNEGFLDARGRHFFFKTGRVRDIIEMRIPCSSHRAVAVKEAEFRGQDYRSGMSPRFFFMPRR